MKGSEQSLIRSLQKKTFGCWQVSGTVVILKKQGYSRNIIQKEKKILTQTDLLLNKENMNIEMSNISKIRYRVSIVQMI